jgi:hypothetical protein
MRKLPPDTLTCDGVAQFFGPDPYGPSYATQCEGRPPVSNWSLTTTCHVAGSGVESGGGLAEGVADADVGPGVTEEVAEGSGADGDGEPLGVPDGDALPVLVGDGEPASAVGDGLLGSEPVAVGDGTAAWDTTKTPAASTVPATTETFFRPLPVTTFTVTE